MRIYPAFAKIGFSNALRISKNLSSKIESNVSLPAEQNQNEMIRNLLKLLLLLVIGILIYNYFMGTSEEKESSKRIFQKVKDVGAEVSKLLKSEKEKFDKGKYDDALQKIDNIYTDLKGKAKEIDEKYLPKIEELQKSAKELDERLQQTKSGAEATAKDTIEQERLKKDLDALLERTRNLMQEMQIKEE